MKEAWIALLKRPAAKTALVTALMFQLIFSVIWMTAYDGVTDRVTGLRLAVVNEDAGMGKAIAEKLSGQLPFGTEVSPSREAAMERLENREVQMVVVLPADFTKQVQTAGQQARIEYYINESNPQMIKSVMTGVTSTITAGANKEAAAAGMQTVLGQQMPAEQAKAVAQGLAEKIVSKVEPLHPVKGMNNQMVPMMLVLASFVGAMIMQMNLHQAAAESGFTGGRWTMFGARALLNAVSALVISALGSALVVAFGGQTEAGYLSVWLFQSLFLAVFMFYSQVFLLVLGAPGMLFNIISLSLQLVTSGAMVPRELLSGFYRGLGDYLPATYAVNGLMNLLFGGPSVGGSAGALLIILAVSLAIGGAAVALRKPRTLAHREGLASDPG
ncbi:YhgE/Pip domain-containing protein [Gorillibacterium sp. sgz5001074]|uniref:YhgE/Pip domain-containing protein n=1 Tax=Gorillibacterium sp. sgz5001074 TaxID=3446695 RepID=UPI003F678F82